MKKLLFIIVMLQSVISYSQTDSVNYKLQQLKSGIEFMRDNFRDSHKEYLTGLYLLGGGFFVSSAGLAIPPAIKKDGSKDYSGNYTIMFVGGVLSVIGTVMMIDSHKYIGRAGHWRFEGDSITFGF